MDETKRGKDLLPGCGHILVADPQPKSQIRGFVVTDGGAFCSPIFRRSLPLNFHYKYLQILRLERTIPQRVYGRLFYYL